MHDAVIVNNRLFLYWYICIQKQEAMKKPENKGKDQKVSWISTYYNVIKLFYLNLEKWIMVLFFQQTVSFDA